MARNGIYPPSVKPGIPRLGRCPDGWKTLRFRDALQVVERDATVVDEQEYQLVIAKRNRGGIEPRERQKGRQILTKTQRFIKGGDFLISRRQIIHGACGLVPADLDGALVSNEYSTLLPKETLSKEYFEYFTHSIHFQQTCFHSSVGVDVEKMVFRLADWLGHRFHLPPMPEQRRIAEVLSAWEQAIALTDRLIEAKQSLKKGLMQQLLTGLVRFPEFGPRKRRTAIPHEYPPRGWRSVRLSDIGTIVAGGTPDTDAPAYWHGEYPWVTPSEITRLPTRFIADTNRTLSEKGLRNSGAVLLPPFSVIVCTRATVGECAINTVPMATNQGFKSIVPKKDYSSDFLYYALRTHERQFRRMAAGSTFFEVPKRDFCKIAIITPDLHEQRRIAEPLSHCDHEIQLLAQKRARLQEQKRGLMQKLLTGAVRLPVNGRMVKHV